TWGRFAGVSSIALAGFVVGLMSLVYYDTWMKARQRKAMLGPGAASVAEFSRTHKPGLSAAQWLSVFIATGIGLHNFSEGLAIGQSAAQDLKSLALVLVIGCGLHNAIEGFGIVWPLSGEAELPSWRLTPGLWIGPTRTYARPASSTRATLGAVPRFATVYPLVTTRALAGPFTYELTNGAAKGAVVSVPLGRSRRRGVVVELVDT